MASSKPNPASGKRWRRWPAAALAAALLALFTFSGGGYSAPENVHGAVYSWAQANPGQPVPVIIETKGDAEAIVRGIDRAGGTVERRFEIIPAVDAEVPFETVASLAENDSVAWISLDAPVVSTGFVDVTNLASTYPFTVNAPSAWNALTPRTGQGVGVAVVDTGVSSSANSDFQDPLGQSRVTFEVAIKPLVTNVNDGYGHGTHVAGIIGGDGSLLTGKYIGIAPSANLIDVKIADDSGNATIADAIAGIQWAVDNKDLYNIRVLNLSLHSAVAQSYKTDPLDAAAEFAWLKGIVVVVSSGNMGTAPDAVSYAPANDPFVIVVGATEEMATPARGDDVVAFFSSRGVTQDGFAKPDVVAPGRYIVSTIDPNSVIARTYPTRFVDQFYFRMSGTSMAAPVVSGIAALMLEQNPALTPGQVKFILTGTAEPLASDPASRVALANAAVFYSGVVGNTDEGRSPNKQIRMNFIAKIGAIAHVLGAPDPAAEAALVGMNLEALGPPGTNLDNVAFEAIKWDAIKWGAIKWDAIKWDAIKWSAIKWDIIKWDAIKWSAIKWGAIKWDAIMWGAITWDAIKWSAIKWDAVTATDATLTGVEFNNTGFDSVAFDAIKWDSFPEP